MTKSSPKIIQIDHFTDRSATIHYQNRSFSRSITLMIDFDQAGVGNRSRREREKTPTRRRLRLQLLQDSDSEGGEKRE